MSNNAKKDPNLTLLGPVPDVSLGYTLFIEAPSMAFPVFLFLHS